MWKNCKSSLNLFLKRIFSKNIFVNLKVKYFLCIMKMKCSDVEIRDYIYFLSCTHLPTKNIQSPVSRKAMRTPTHISVENGNSRLKGWSSESALLRIMKLSPVWMKGVVMSTKRSLTAVTVSGATARSASWQKLQQQGSRIQTSSESIPWKMKLARFSRSIFYNLPCYMCNILVDMGYYLLTNYNEIKCLKTCPIREQITCSIKSQDKQIFINKTKEKTKMFKVEVKH
ncbi:hypothetical protein XENOCAPTIV_026206 [Xenoophorus captivus]|uniref:Uncharacterized protein n=1 Tax=Xenoophorus captivus TaxID=1517983 RepID=A0ABV0RAG2_9TELE